MRRLYLRTVHAGCPGAVRLRRRGVRCTQIVGVYVVLAAVMMRVAVRRGHPAVAVHIVVVGAHIARTVYYTRIRIVCRHRPRYRGLVQRARRAEAQVLRRVVHMSGAVEPDALQVYWHVNLLASVGVPAVNPQLIVCRVHFLGPDLVQQNIGLDFVLIATVNHQFALSVEITHRSVRLAAGEVEHRRGAGRDGPCHHNC